MVIASRPPTLEMLPPSLNPSLTYPLLGNAASNSEETRQRYRTVGGAVFNFIDRGIETKTFCTASFTTRLLRSFGRPVLLSN